MSQIKNVIKVIDEELLSKDLPFLSLAAANKLLLEKGIFTPDDLKNRTLKKYLEENLIPNSYQTEHSPKQWRLRLSNLDLKDKRKVLVPKNQTKPKAVLSAPQVKAGKTKALIFLTCIGIFLIYDLITMNKDRTEQTTHEKFESMQPGMYKPGSNDWPYYGKSTTELINVLNLTFSGKLKSLENEKKLYEMVGGMYINKPITTSTVRRYDLLEVPISMSYRLVNGTWVYGSFTPGGVKIGDPRLNLK